MNWDYEITPSRHERKVEFHAQAPEARLDTRYNRRPSIRMAGEIFPESPRERRRRLDRERVARKQKSTPVGYGEFLGFADKDNYGPDNDYASRETITYRHDREY